VTPPLCYRRNTGKGCICGQSIHTDGCQKTVSGVSPHTPSTLFFESVSHWDLGHVNWAELNGQHAWGSSYGFPSDGTTSFRYHSWFLKVQ